MRSAAVPLAVMLLSMCSLTVQLSLPAVRSSRHTVSMSNPRIDFYMRKIEIASSTMTCGELELAILAAGESKLAVISTEARNSPQFIDAQKRCEFTGRSSVDSALQRFQRLIQQLDRSDGRSDIPYDQLADRFYDLVGTALRTPGQAWMVYI